MFAKQITATTYNFGISNSSNTANFSSAVLKTGQTYLIVIRNNINNNYPSLKLNTMQAWINPSLTSEPDTKLLVILMVAIQPILLTAAVLLFGIIEV
jgi:hypothetical protein